MVGIGIFGVGFLNDIPNAPRVLLFCAVFPRNESKFGDLSNRACAFSPLPPYHFLATNPLAAQFIHNMLARGELLSSL